MDDKKNVSIADLMDTFYTYTNLMNDIITEVRNYLQKEIYYKSIYQNTILIVSPDDKSKKMCFCLKYKNENKFLMMPREVEALIMKDSCLMEKIYLLDELYFSYPHVYKIKYQKKSSYIKIMSSVCAVPIHDGVGITNSTCFAPYNRCFLFPDVHATVKVCKYKQYQELVKALTNEETKRNRVNLFSAEGKVLDKYRHRTLEEFDLGAIDFDNKNISGLNISKNPEAHINFDKIEKDLTNCNFNGYNLNKVTLRNFNLTDTDLRNTKATVDLATCVVSVEGKLNSGTLFDEENTFVFGYTKIDRETLNKLNIKIYKKCYNRNRK